MVVGILNSFAALARATAFFFSVWRSIDWTPNAICGWWSIKMTCEFCGVRTSSFGLAMGDLLYTRSLKNGSTVHCRATRKKSHRARRGDPGELNLTISNAAIYCTLVVRDAVMVSLRSTMV